VLRRLRSTPARLRLAVVSAVLVSSAFGVVGLTALLAKSGALDRARAESATQSRLQSVRTHLVVADAAAGVDVLLGPDQPRLAPNDVRFALVPAALGLVVAARDAADVPALAAAGLRLTEYVGQADSARELARLRRPEAAARLGSASRQLRSEVLPRLVQVQQAGSARLQDDVESSTRGTAEALAAGAFAVVVLVGGHLWLARRTRRLVNPGLAAGFVLLGVLTGVVLAVSAGSDDRAQQVRSGPFLVAQHLSEARIAAFDARAVESLGVVGDDVAAAEPGWRTAMGTARAALDRASSAATTSGASGAVAEIREARRLLELYAGVHARLLGAAGSGARDVARTIAVSPTVEGAPGAFEDVDTATAALLARQAQAADDGWVAAGAHLELLGWVCLLAGCGAAALTAGGLLPRLREYR